MAVRALNNSRILEAFPHTAAVTAITDALCKEHDLTQDLCYEFLFTMAGPSRSNQDRAKLADYLANLPAGSALKQIAHYGQLMDSASEVFRQFDYGSAGNLQRYGTAEPPEYQLRRVTCNLTLWWGATDDLAVQSNVEKIHILTPNSTAIQVASPEWNHLDFLIRLDVKAKLHDGVLAVLADYDRQHP
ncbi:hypothetical protein ONE63_005181 [Megalurothrips usitatus]|uniref:Uncharacterized protein n=1 Tax=Megalurothrips usitatus TaxID=439358 RepID=A0AAV7XUJ9_9NEOP|nr:hypothetical protein ONE63_005181 [Megalurothrips usitatus]